MKGSKTTGITRNPVCKAPSERKIFRAEMNSQSLPSLATAFTVRALQKTRNVLVCFVFFSKRFSKGINLLQRVKLRIYPRTKMCKRNGAEKQSGIIERLVLPER